MSHYLMIARQWHPTPVLLPGNSHGQSSLAGYSPWGHKESDTTERLHFRLHLLVITRPSAWQTAVCCMT